MENSLLEILFTVHVITLCVLDISQNAKELSPNGDKIYVKYHLTVVSVFDATLIVVILMCGLSITIWTNGMNFQHKIQRAHSCNMNHKQ